MNEEFKFQLKIKSILLLFSASTLHGVSNGLRDGRIPRDQTCGKGVPGEGVQSGAEGDSPHEDAA